MYGEYHTIPYQSKLKEKFVGPFSLSQTLWIGTGLWLSFQMSKYVPMIGNDWLYSRLHYAIPFLICLFLCYAHESSTKLPYWKYLYYILRLRVGRRIFIYRKINTVKGGDRI